MTAKPEATDSASLQAMDTVKKKRVVPPGSRKGMGGRKSTYTEAKGLEICALLSDGVNLNKILQDKALPSRNTVMRWVLEIPEFGQRYAQAREALLDTYADEIMTISDDGTTDYIIKSGRNGHEYMAVDQEHIQRSRLRVDSRRWILSKLRPGQYGDRLVAEVSGTVDHKHDISSLTEREKMRRFALFMMEDQRQLPIEGQASNVTKSHLPNEGMAKVSRSAPMKKTEPDASA